MFWNKGEKQRKNCSSALVSVQAFNLYFSLGFKLISNRLSADCLFGVKALHMMEIQLFCAWFLFPNSSCLHLFFFFLYIYIYIMQKMKGFAYLVFPNSVLSVLLEGSSLVEGESTEHGIITSVTHGVMPGTLT